MRCPKCDAESSVLETRAVVGNMARRRRVCDSTACGTKFVTVETVVTGSVSYRDSLVVILPKHIAREVRRVVEILRDKLGPESAELDDVAHEGEQRHE